MFQVHITFWVINMDTDGVSMLEAIDRIYKAHGFAGFMKGLFYTMVPISLFKKMYILFS